MTETSNFEHPDFEQSSFFKGDKKQTFAQALSELSKYQAQNTSQIQETAFTNKEIGREKLQVNISRQLFSSCKFDSATISSSQFTDCTFNKCSFIATDMFNVKFHGCKFIQCSFKDAKMQDVDFTTSTAYNCILNDQSQRTNVVGFSSTDLEMDKNVVDTDLDGDEDEDDEDDRQIISDSYKPTIKSGSSDPKKWKSLQTVKEAMESLKFTLQDEDDNVWQIYHENDQNTGFALYPNPSNSQEDKQIWTVCFFYAGQMVLQNQIQLQDLDASEVEEAVSNFIDLAKGENAKSAMEKIVDLMFSQQD